MWRKLVLLSLAALGAAAPANAAERVIAPDADAYVVSAYRGWVMWQSEKDATLWRDGKARRFAPPGTGPSGVQKARVGSDARGRTAVAYLDCAKTLERGRWSRCQVVQHVLATGSERTLLAVAESDDVNIPEISRGALALPFGNVTDDPALRLFRPGRRALRLAEEAPGTTDMESGRLVYAGHDEYAFPGHITVARAIDLRGRRPRLRTLARHDGGDEDGRTGAAVTLIDAAANDGRYAYWLRTTSHHSQSSDEIWRADLNDPRATVEKIALGGPARSIAVTGGRLYYAGRYDGRVVEVTDPAWQDTGLRTPVRT